MIELTTSKFAKFSEYCKGKQGRNGELKLPFEKLLSYYKENDNNSKYALCNTALFDILNNEKQRYDKNYELYISSEGYGFDPELINSAAKSHNYTASKIYTVGSDKIEIKVRADYLRGIYCYKNKFTWSEITFDEYNDSPEWKFLLDIFGSYSVKYNVVGICEKQGVVTLNESEQFEFISYEGMERDLIDFLATYIDFLKNNSLLN